MFRSFFEDSSNPHCLETVACQRCAAATWCLTNIPLISLSVLPGFSISFLSDPTVVGQLQEGEKASAFLLIWVCFSQCYTALKPQVAPFIFLLWLTGVKNIYIYITTKMSIKKRSFKHLFVILLDFCIHFKVKWWNKRLYVLS